MGYRDVAPWQGMVWDLGSPAGWQHNLELEEALGGSVIQVSVPSGNPGHMRGWDAGPRSKAPGLFSQISNPGHQSQPWGAGSFRRPGHRTGLAERAPAPPCQPGLPSD